MRPGRSVFGERALASNEIVARLCEIGRRMQITQGAGSTRHHTDQVVSFCSVVGEKDNDRVVVLANLLQIIEYAPDLVVHVFNHRGI